MASILLYVGSAVIVLWGIGHLLPTRGVVAAFGSISDDNKRIITMEWIAEGVTLCFVGVLVAAVAGSVGQSVEATRLVARLSAVMLYVLAAVSAATGARTSTLPMKLCPLVKSVVASMYVVASGSL